MTDDLMLADDQAVPAQPLPVTPLAPQPTQPVQAPGMTQQWQQAAPLLAMIPLAMKRGGQPAVAALLQGYQQAQAMKQQRQQQQFQNDRLTAQDQRAGRQEAATEGYRRSQIEHDRITRQQQLRQQFAQAIGTVESPEAVNALLDFYGPQADALGVGRESLSTFALQSATPSTLEKRGATKALTLIEKTYKPEQLAQLEQAGAKFDAGGGQKLTLGELRAMAGTAAFDAQGQPMAAPTPAATDRRGFQRVEALLDGQAAFVMFDPDTGKYFDAKGVDVSTRIKPMPPDRIVYPAPQNGSDPRQIATFNQIAGAYERSPLIRAADRTIVLRDAITSIEKNPSDPASQLALAYSYIQALDTYQSAVREGELQNLNVLGSAAQRFTTQLNRVIEGAFLPPEVAKNIASNAKQLVSTIETGRSRKEQEFASRARVSGVGGMWDSFVGGFARPAEAPPSPAGRATVTPSQAPPARVGGAGPARANPFRTQGPR